MGNKSRNILRSLLGWAVVLFLVFRPVVVCASNALTQSRVAAALSDDSASAKKAPSLFNYRSPLKKIAKQLPRPKNLLAPVVLPFSASAAQAPPSFAFRSILPHRPPLVALRI